MLLVLTTLPFLLRFNTTQFSRSFIPPVTRLWNDLPNHVVESVQPHNFKCGANSFLLSTLLVYPCYSRLIFFFFFSYFLIGLISPLELFKLTDRGSFYILL